MKKISILVLGVGGNVSQGILKAIAVSEINCRVVGACVNSESIGLYLCDTAYLAPYANSETFIPWLIKICNDENIDIVFTGVEENILEIAAHMDQFNRGTKAVFKCTPYEYLTIGQDKLKTCKWLKENGCNYAKYCSSEEVEKVIQLVGEVGFPLIAKPRKGKGSNGIFRISNKEELEQVLGLKGYIIQELIGNDNDEYTVGCYCDKYGNLISTIIMRRELRYGTTFKAEVIENPLIKEEAEKICEKFKPTGPLNIQLRIDKDNKPICFELNVRFSGTTPMRAHFGFNDVEAMIKEYILGQNISQTFNVKKGISYRYMNEIYLYDNVQSKLQQDGFVSCIRNHSIAIDALGVRR